MTTNGAKVDRKWAGSGMRVMKVSISKFSPSCSGLDMTVRVCPKIIIFPKIDHPVALCKQNGTIFALSDNDDGINPIKMMEPSLCQLHISIVTTPY